MEHLVIIFSHLPLPLACFTCSYSCSSSPETGFPSIDVREGSLPTLQNQEHLISIHPHILPRLHEAERLLFLVSPLLTTISLLPALFPSSLSISYSLSSSSSPQSWKQGEPAWVAASLPVTEALGPHWQMRHRGFSAERGCEWGFWISANTATLAAS